MSEEEINNTFENVLVQYANPTCDVGEDKEIETESDKVIGMPLDNICFMKHYFKAKGLDPESEDFITDVLKLNEKPDTSWLKPKPSINDPNKIHPFTWTDKGTGTITYTMSSLQDLGEDKHE